MIAAVQNDLYRVFTAYREGIVRKASIQGDPAPILPRELDFNQLSDSACLGLSSPQERLIARKAGAAGQRGFLAARAGDLDLAQTHFATSWALWEKLEDGFCQAWTAGLIESFQAYLDYRSSRRNDARLRIERALDSALLLEDRYGLTLFELLRIQLGHNLARIDWRFGLYEGAFALAGALIGHLQGSRQELPFHRDWRASRMLACPSYMRRRMTLQIAREAIGLLVAHPEPAYWDAFLGEAKIGDRPADRRLFGDPRLYLWLCARRARNLGDRRQYLDTLVEILVSGPLGLGTAYYSILVDFADFCSTEQSVAARKVIDFFSRDAPKWKGLPTLLAERLAEIFGGRRGPSANLAMAPESIGIGGELATRGTASLG